MTSIDFIRRDFSLAELNTFGVASSASFFCRVETLESLRRSLEICQDQGLPLLILGGGSNFLFVTPQLDAFVIQPALTGIRYHELSDNDVLVTAAAGENWHQLVMATLQQGLCGLENLALIPGSVGAAPIQNIGAYGVELADRLVSVQAVEIVTGHLRHFHRSELQLGYRDSIFKREQQGRYVITEVTLLLHRHAELKTGYDSLAKELAKQPDLPLTAARVADAVMAVRRARLPDPAVLGNAGSFFKNPVVSAEQALRLQQVHPTMPVYPQPNGEVKLAAGWLIEQAGMKGVRRGQAGTHQHQALVLVNYGGASGAELWALAREVQTAVREKFAVALEPEVWIVGGR